MSNVHDDAPVGLTEAVVVRLPPGIAHHVTTARAESWAAYDALVTADGWEEKQWHVLGTSPCEPDTPGATVHVQKQAEVDGCHVVVFRPFEQREDRA